MINRYLKCAASALLMLAGYYLLQLLVTAVFAAIGGMGVSVGIQAAMEDYILANTLLITLVFNIILSLLALLFFRGGRFAPAWGLPLGLPARGGCWPLLAAGAATACFVSLILSLLPLPEETLSAYNTQVAQGAEGSFALRFISMAIAAPVAEELFFRGALYGRLREGFPRAAALLLCCAVFGLMHGALLWAAYAFLVGAALTLIYELYRTLAAPMLFHIAFNITGMFIMPGLYLTSPLFTLALLLFAGVAALSCIRPMKAAAGERKQGG